MSVFYIILLVLFLLVLLGGYFVLFDLFLFLEDKLNKVLSWFAGPLYRLSNRYVRPRHKNYLMFGTAILAAVYVLYAFLTAENAFTCFQSIVMSTSIGAAVELFQSGIDVRSQIAYASLVAVAFGSFLSYVYMKFTISNLENLDLNVVIRWLLFVLLNVLFIAFSTLLTEHMTVFFSKAADLIFSVYTRLSGKVANTQVHRFWDVFPLIGSWIVLIPILVTAFLTAVITVREYLANLFYGLASLLMLIAVGLVFTWITSKLTNFPTFISDVFIVLSMFLVDYIRADDNANTKFKQVVKDISDGAKDLLLAVFSK